MPSLDLVILAPGKDEREAMDGLLGRRQRALGIRPVTYQILVHTRRDPGCFHEGPDTLRVFQRQAHHALVMLDHEGSGRESHSCDETIRDLSERLSSSGWGDRAAVLVLEPELEAWVWGGSSAVDSVLGWKGRQPALRSWLAGRGFLQTASPKPSRPKEALLAALRESRVRKSSALYRQLAETVDFGGCRDPAFTRLRQLLISWFPDQQNG